MRVGGWRLLGLLLAAGVALAMLAVVLFWVALAVALVGALAALNLIYLPRLAAGLRLDTAVLALGLLPILALIGWVALGDVVGLGWGTVIWLAAVGAPRLLAAYLVRRLVVRFGEASSARPYDPLVIQGVAREVERRPGERPPLPEGDGR